ncbi:MAG: ribose-phosphate diphosphokinase [Rhizobacter sp.]|nr:ribose-phosphate diphosphokinase [Rhizobacter sp.]
MPLHLIAIPGADACADLIARHLHAARVGLDHRRFPDGETYLRVLGDVRGAEVAVVAQLRDPDAHIPGLLFLADTLRELGAHHVGLIAPYLPYMRQDARFQPGEAVTSVSFARLMSAAFDWLVTVDPHLHRHACLGEIYTIPSEVVPSAPAIAAWVQMHVKRPHLIGPDEESAQWVGEVAAYIGSPHTVLQKARHGDRSVSLSVPDLAALAGRTPVLVDDIVSSAHTLAEAVRVLRAHGAAPPVCVGVHALFAEGAAELLAAAGAACVVTCNTVPHASNAIDVTGALAEAARGLDRAVAAGHG